MLTGGDSDRVIRIAQIYSLLRRLGFRIANGPGTAEHQSVSQTGRICFVLPVILEEQADTLFWQDVCGLQTCRVYGIKRRVLIETGVGGNLPLVVTDHAKLQKLGEILLQWQDLTNPPLVRERLPRSNVRSVLVAADGPAT